MIEIGSIQIGEDVNGDIFISTEDNTYVVSDDLKLARLEAAILLYLDDNF